MPPTQDPLRICLLTEQDLDQDPFPADDWPCDPRPFLPDAEWSSIQLEKTNAVQKVIEASREGYDVYFNLCDGAWDEGRVGLEVVQALEWLNVPFTGADSAFYEPSREAMKRVCAAWGINTPAYAIVRNETDIVRALDMLRFPMFVKHPNGYASNGITRDSRVDDEAGLRAQTEIMIRLAGEALVEEYVDGAECTVLVVESAADPASPITYVPLKYRFPEGEAFKHYELKWEKYQGLEAHIVEDASLAEELRSISAQFFQGMRGASYGRCDIRLDSDGRPFMLEINPNCGVYYPPADAGSADLILQADPAGHVGFTRALVDAAFARHRRRQKPWEVLPRGPGDWGVFATRPISAGQCVMSWEREAHTLVSLAHVEENWSAPERTRFYQYAWPLTDEIFVTWDADPEHWRPVNRSCDPSAWLQGLDVIARRNIAAGEEITLEYATLYDERMPAFDCACGAASCRGVVRGDDWRTRVIASYEGHLSDHIRKKRSSL